MCEHPVDLNNSIASHPDKTSHLLNLPNSCNKRLVSHSQTDNFLQNNCTNKHIQDTTLFLEVSSQTSGTICRAK